MPTDPALAAYLRALPGDLEALRTALPGGSLDLSYGSLDRLEDHYRAVLEAGDAATTPGIGDRVTAYIGATLVERTGGKWAMGGEPGESPHPRVVDLPHLRRGAFSPRGPSWDFKRLRAPGLLRDRTELWDIALRRSELARLLRETDRELDALDEDVHALTGEPLDDRDGSPASLDRLEAALRALIANDAPREQRRRVRERAVFYLGNLALRAREGAEWGVCEDPRYSDLGHFTAGDWAPYADIRAVGPKRPPGHLRMLVDDELAPRKRDERRRPAGAVAAPAATRSRQSAKSSYFLSYFAGEATIADVERVLRKAKMSIARKGDELTARRKPRGKPAMSIGLNDEPHVRLEAAELAARHGHPSLAACDRRFEVAFDDLANVLHETNTLFEVGAQLQRLTRGYVVYAWNGHVLVPDGNPCPCRRCK